MTRIALPEAGQDLRAFKLEGWLDGTLVTASWDGQILEVADLLVGRVGLAESVDAVFGEAGLDAGSWRLSITRCASLALLTLTEICEELTCLEYESFTDCKKIV
jgi:hypothetical protein